MQQLIALIRSSARDFDSSSYPVEFYFDRLRDIARASSAAALCHHVVLAIAWKDRKIRRKAVGSKTGGALSANDGAGYTMLRTRPNTLSARHTAILRSQAFFEWARRVRNLRHFDIEVLHQLRRFGLWRSVVIPVFVLHCLNPRVFPIADRWVFAAHRRWTSPEDRALPPSVTDDAYVGYQAWWAAILKVANLDPLSAPLPALKEIDAGLWVIGKHAGSEANARAGRAARAVVLVGHGIEPAGRRTVIDTGSAAFKRLAVDHWKAGKTQMQSILEAANELGISLKPSYMDYPASHFHRWRLQGVV